MALQALIWFAFIFGQSQWDHRAGEYELVKLGAVTTNDMAKCGDYFLVRNFPKPSLFFFYWTPGPDGKRSQSFDLKAVADTETVIDNKKSAPTVQMSQSLAARKTVFRLSRKDYDLAKSCLKAPLSPI